MPGNGLFIKAYYTAAGPQAQLLEEEESMYPAGAKQRNILSGFSFRQTNALGWQMEAASPQRRSPDASAPENYSPEYQDALRLAAGAREYDTHQLATAILVYAVEHHGQIASNFEVLTPVLDRITKGVGQSAISGTNQFEIIYRGSLSDLDGIPTGNVAVLRHHETWAAPDGKMARVYGMLDGHTRIITSDDNFKSWEAEHVIDSTATP